MPAGAEKPLALPQLREDLELIPGGGEAKGWLIYDPAQHRYVKIDRNLFQLLGLWGEFRSGEGLLQAAHDRFGLSLTIDDIRRFVAFADANHLTVENAKGWRGYAETRIRQQRSVWSKLVHNYLFFRIPLFRPDRFLNATYPFISCLFSRVALAVIALTGVAGLYLVSRQWEAFLGTFQHFYSLEGLVVMGLVLGVSKTLHELGHAYTAVRHGCRVPTAGIAFMMMAPLLYTDVTDAWRLKSRRARIAIGAAGVAVELALALVATFIWAFLPEGPLKSAAFLVATVNWAMSVAVNLNPFMRFDGYYLLSDLLDVENLQPRAFAIGRWRMREILFGLRAPAPEPMPRSRLRLLYLYAWATWIYRLLLFVGIALVVYAYFMKVLGVVLFLVEIGVFVAGPVWAELKEWWKMRSDILKSRRTVLTLGTVGVSVLLAALPVSTRVSIPAIVEAEGTALLFPPRAADVVSVDVVPGQRVDASDVVARLASVDLEHALRLAKLKRELTRQRLARRTADEEDRSDSLVLERELALLTAKIEGLERERGELVVTAGRAGIVREVNPHLHPGRAVSRKEPLALVGQERAHVARGYLAESDLWRIGTGSTGTFIPDDPGRPVFPVTVGDIAVSGAASIEIAELASTHHGPIAVQVDGRKQQVPVTAQYLVRFRTQDLDAPPATTIRGWVHVEGAAESLLARTVRQALKVLVRESGA